MTWLSLDGRVIILARGLRTFAQASIAVLLAIYLDLLGFSLKQIGFLMSAGAAGGAFFSFIIVLLGDRFGRRRLLTWFSLVTGATGLALALTDQLLLLAAVAFLGSFTFGGGGARGPVQPLEQAMLPETAPPARRTDLFAFAGIFSHGATALGALAAGLPAIFQSSAGMSEVASYKVMFLTFTALMTLSALLYLLLSQRVEAGALSKWSNPFRLPSRRNIFTFAALFSLDSFATNLVIQSLVALWFKEKFGVELSSVALLFFASQVLSAASQWVAAKIANRIGLLNTIVFTHIPAVGLLVAMPFAPNVGLASACWILRGFFNLMDVPTKQSYTMAVVNPSERAAMGGINNVTQSVIATASPSVATALWAAFSPAVPFLACGVLKAIYLAGFYVLFRKVRPPEEEERRARRQEASRV